ncbi:MAG: hypothetical protein CMP24_00370 [Rickettsiales bacterium]|nr:hypothetical protein [Rickettsiales bacterium]
MSKNNILAITNRKGGVGKTTLAVNLSVGLALNHNLQCVLIDADPIGSSTLWLENTAVKGMKLRRLSLPNSGGNVHHALHTWGAAVSNMALDCDVVIADLPPIDIIVFSELLRQVSGVVIPVGLSSLEWEATFPLIERVISASKDSDETKGIIVPSRIHPQKRLPREKIIEVLPSQWKLSPQLSLRTDFQRAAEYGHWVGKTAPKSPAHNEMNEVIRFIFEGLNLT